MKTMKNHFYANGGADRRLVGQKSRQFWLWDQGVKAVNSPLLSQETAIKGKKWRQSCGKHPIA
jgi:hypothetical protein